MPLGPSKYRMWDTVRITTVPSESAKWVRTGEVGSVVSITAWKDERESVYAVKRRNGRVVRVPESGLAPS